MTQQFPEIINWSPNGSEMEIYDIGRFSVEVHPLYFTTSNYQSFQRQVLPSPCSSTCTTSKR